MAPAFLPAGALTLVLCACRARHLESGATAMNGETVRRGVGRLSMSARRRWRKGSRYETNRFYSHVGHEDAEDACPADDGLALTEEEDAALDRAWAEVAKRYNLDGTLKQAPGMTTADP